ncbi:tetratricopeptide repeat protein [Scandinavium sp. V105_16]|uniref:Tetratricopeptide repeat protein n=1 Tax=Scandinavium lactucae TaxID=3095028 RepID=A0AAJ2S795_9ENTR|nr:MULTISPECIES: tetratricopeptide repeat protein [unclassified Scandinavium]MDX6021092.1 tetratricopeptide repeat protein [Scandinavium sp. V105_16]MDX6031083.1 tetratricopeptide repeat protein [Scandinavium sp. V105_12]MDX6041627.1 tetratricopeptide repeat protein [Scandinavium sp. V105_6]MDX6049548.1 tetratricopeptide repeat protein [Scandinavium sp. V105_1]
MKRSVWLLLFPLLAHANEIGSQYKEQAEAGDTRAQYYLADTYYSSGDESHARYWAEKAAKAGEPDAVALLAQMMMKTSWPDARKLAEQAVLAGSSNGEITLAHTLVNTQAGKTDYPRALSLLQKAAENTDSDAAVDAQMLLGLIYANGGEVAEDDAKATFWFKRSSTLSRSGYAEYWAGKMFQEGEKGFIAPNTQKALNWFNVSCLEGNDSGCEELDALSGE